MRASLLIVLTCLSAIGTDACASVRLVNSKALLPASRVIRPRRYAAFSARLSPDGKHLLFPSLVDNKDYSYGRDLSFALTGHLMEN